MTGTISFHEQLGNRGGELLTQLKNITPTTTSTRIFSITVLCHNFTVSSAKLQRCKS